MMGGWGAASCEMIPPRRWLQGSTVWPPCAATLPQTHPLKTRIATLLQALNYMRDWQVNPFYRGFRHLSFPFHVSWDLDFCPTPGGRTHTRAANGPFFQAPVINGWVLPFFLKGVSPHSNLRSS
jgi:hypothetical protein